MALRKILRKATGRRAIRRARRPGLEVLESRQLLAASTSEFPTTLVGGMPTSITTGSDGNLWFTLPTFGAIGSLNPTTHAFQTFSLPDVGAGDQTIVSGPDGNLWIATGATIVTFSPTSHSVVGAPIALAGPPTAIANGPDGFVWFTEDSGTGGVLGAIDPATRDVSVFDVPVIGEGLAEGADGNLWLVNPLGQIVSFNPVTHASEVFNTPTGRVPIQSGSLSGFLQEGPTSIVAGPDGNLWFTETQGNRVGTINPTTHANSEFFLPTPNSFPTSITAGPDGQLWFTESGATKNNPFIEAVRIPYGQAAIASIDPVTHAIATYPTPSVNTGPEGITVGPDGHLWFAEQIADQIGEAILHPADGPQVLSVSRLGVHTQPTSLVLAFNQPLDATSAQNLSNYQLVGPNKRTIPIRSAVYDAAAGTVTLAPVSRLSLHASYALTVVGTAPNGIRDIYGDLLDGAGTGQPGSDYHATITARNLVLGHPVPTLSHATLHPTKVVHPSPRPAAVARPHH
jgi:virginiamycin B lyase